MDEPCCALDPISTGDDREADRRAARAISRSSSSRTTSRRRIASPTGSRSCTSATSSSTDRPEQVFDEPRATRTRDYVRGRSDERACPPGLVMRPGVLKRALVVVACGALTVTLAACESTESESAKIEREASKSRESEPGALKLGAANRRVHVSDATLLSSAGARLSRSS